MATAAAEARPDELTIDSPFAATLRVHLGAEKYTLGRSSGNDIAFPEDQRLSREHLVFKRNANHWTVQDVGSRNGTLLNGERLTPKLPAQLSPGDLIAAGRLSIRFHKRTSAVQGIQDEITFFEEEGEFSATTESLDLRSALQTASSLSGRARRKKEYLETLVQAARELAGHGALNKIFEVILELSLRAANASRGVVLIRETNESLKIRAIRGDGLRISTKVRDLVLNEGRSVLINDIRLDKAFRARESILAQQIRSILAVPLQTDEHVIGMLYLDSPHLVCEFGQEDLKLVTVMANIAAIRIEHARLVEQEHARQLLIRDLERAAEIQRRLLPATAPEIAGFDLAGYNLPCRTVGGDYYDFLPHPSGLLTVLIGDVSGKGLGAALLMSNLQARAHVILESSDPLDSQISRLNRSIGASCPRDAFITLFAGQLDPITGELAYCNAGHNPPLLLHAPEKLERLEATGIPLGIIREAEYGLQRCQLEPGDLLVLFSDGVTEACASTTPEEFGESRLITTVLRKRNDCAAAMVEAVNADLVSFTDGVAAADDITLVVVRRLAASRSASSNK